MKAFIYAFRGLGRGLVSGRNVLLQCLAVVAVTVFGIVKEFAEWQWIAVVLCFMVVIALELVNTAIEKLCDALHSDKSDAIRDVKDMAAGAVLWASIGSAAVFLIVVVTAV